MAMKRHVLIIEDHDFQRKVLVMQLNNYGVEKVAAVSCGYEALNYIQKEQPDLLICDLNMPTMDGVELLQRLGDDKYQGEIIISSAQNEMVINSAVKMCLEFKLNLLGQIEKPVTKEKLLDLLEKSSAVLASTPVSTEKRIITKDDLVIAVNNKEFELYYQPLVCFKTGEWKESEALIRWNHPKYGLLSPYFFLQQLQDLGLMDTVMIDLLQQAIADLPTLGFRRFAFNITSGDLIKEDFTNYLINLIDTKKLSAANIRLELTESDVVQNLGRALASATRIYMKGVTLAIDDFGTGYSSLKQLDDLPFSELKLDVDFVKNISSSKSAKAIVQSSLYLGELLGLDIVAEGVENIYLWKELQTLCNEKCLAQGYFISYPLPAKELEGWHKEWLIKVDELHLSTSL